MCCWSTLDDNANLHFLCLNLRPLFLFFQLSLVFMFFLLLLQLIFLLLLFFCNQQLRCSYFLVVLCLLQQQNTIQS